MIEDTQEQEIRVGDLVRTTSQPFAWELGFTHGIVIKCDEPTCLVYSFVVPCGWEDYRINRWPRGRLEKFR